MTHRWEEIAQAIQKSIDSGKLHVGDRLSSETELAAQWQVARMTVHRAMNDLHQRGIVTRKRRVGTVVAEAQPKRQGTVGLLFFHTNDFPQADYIHGIRAGLPDALDLLFCDTRNDPLSETAHLHRMQTQADAILCYPTCDPRCTPMLNKIITAGLPLVCVDRIPDGVSADAVVTDNFGSTLQALRHIMLQGHREIAFLGYNEMEVSSARERYAAYLQAMAEAGHPDASRWTRLFPKGMGYDFESLAQTVHDALFTLRHLPEPATAIFCEDDYFMTAVLEACERQGLRVPQDFRIASFNDCPTFIPRLTRGVDRLVQQSQIVGRMAAERLQQRLAGENPPVEVTRVPAQFYPSVEAIPTPELSAVPNFTAFQETDHA